jgi:coenzyme F420 hydrogenase subunit beta
MKREMPAVKSKQRFQNAMEVARWRLCVGCGTCFSVCPEHKIVLVDIEEDGIRPIIRSGPCGSCGICLDACPGIITCLPAERKRAAAADERSEKRWGAVMELWEGYASDPQIRFMGSSGGLCTALSLFCLERGFADGVLHIGNDSERPWKNYTYRSVNRAELLARTGSRYAPASPGGGLQLIEDAAGPSVFIGKPCDIAGLKMAQTLRPGLARKTALSIGFFCAGTPSTNGTLELLRQYGIGPEEVAELRYRGMGWPGAARMVFKDARRQPLEVSYNDSWGFIQKYRPFRCYLCPDLTAEFADISVGDPWYRETGESEPGRSLVLIRTERGREIFHHAIGQGYVSADPCSANVILRSQKNLLGKRQAIWGRLLAMKLLGVPYPNLRGFHLLQNWLDLPAKEKVKSIVGTGRRIIQRNYFKPLEYVSKGGAWRTACPLKSKR